MNTTTASQGTVEHIDPNAIIIEANVRPSAPLTKEFVASIRENGVLTPVLARRDAQGNVLVRAGQRRTLAAREAGLSSIPAYIVEADEATVERIVQQMVENDQREALTDGDRAAAFQQLAFEGLSAAAIAKRTGTKQAVVKSGLAVAENAVAASAIQEHQLTLDQAATLIEFDDDEATRAALIDIAIKDPAQFAHTAQRARDERERSQVKAKAEDELRVRGYEILDREPSYYETDYISIRELATAEGERVTPEHIENVEGRAVFVRVYFDGEPNITYYLSDPKAAGFKKASGQASNSGPMTDEQKAERRTLIANNKAWASVLLTELPGATSWRRGGVADVDDVDDVRQGLLNGEVGLLAVGAVRQRMSGLLPFAVLDEDGAEIEAFSLFLSDLVLTDMSPLTVRSYGNDLLRWWRVLQLLGVAWDRAGRPEVEVLVGWMRSAANPQRRGESAGLVNPRTGKRALSDGYAPATINHALAVLSSFYAFHARFGRGPVVNPVPETIGQRTKLAHRNPLEQSPGVRRAPLRQKSTLLAPRSIPDDLVDELIGVLRTSRDRALVTLYLSTGARASELLGVRGAEVDWAGQRVWVISKGSRVLEPVPASPEAFRYLAAYFHEHGTPQSEEVIWRTIHGRPRPLNYHAARRILQRANAILGTDWTLHDLRHTTISRMVSDPNLTVPDVMAVTRHRRVSSMDPYLRPRIDEVFEKVQEHFATPTPERSLTPGYDADDFTAVFGG